jgi:NAD(P)-dependent dehydrogenase (short-subunit alcohol dehydrogenase family)
MPTQQIPIHSGFEAATTTAEVIRGINLKGKTVIVTGGDSGLGLETVKTLSSAGATVIVPARDREMAIQSLKGLSGVEIEPMELSDPKSVNDFADRFLASGRPLHILVNNAGIMAPPLKRDQRGYESQLSINYLGHFQLTVRLLPALRLAKGARVISVASSGHRFSPFNFEDPNFERRDYNPWLGYGQSKTATILLTVEIDKRYAKDGIRAFSLHPGGILATGLAKHVSQEELRAAGALGENGKPLIDPAKGLKTVEQGAATAVWCATSLQLEGKGGVYCEDVDIAPLASQASGNEVALGDTVQGNGVMSYAIDPESAHRLWELSEKLTGVSVASLRFSERR